jgi:hypothetical protein
MAQALPLILAALAGLALVSVLTALWQSMRVVLLGGAQNTSAEPTVTHEAQKSRALAREALVREKNTLLQAIRDVRFEHDLGKISDADLERLDAQYRVRARALLAELDAQLTPYRDRARTLLGLTVTGAPSVNVPAPAPAPESSSLSPAASHCASCSTANDPDAVFCKKCGARMASEVAS